VSGNSCISIQWCRNQFESGGHRPQSVVLVSAFVVGSTVWSLSYLLFFYSRYPRAQSFVKRGHVPRALWSRRHCQNRGIGFGQYHLQIVVCLHVSKVLRNPLGLHGGADLRYMALMQLDTAATSRSCNTMDTGVRFACLHSSLCWYQIILLGSRGNVCKQLARVTRYSLISDRKSNAQTLRLIRYRATVSLL